MIIHSVWLIESRATGNLGNLFARGHLIMLSREERIQKMTESLRNKPESGSFDLENIMASWGAKPPSSEVRFDKLDNRAAAVSSIKDAATAFARDARLEVKVINDVFDVPILSSDSQYKYSMLGGGSFREHRRRMGGGEQVLIVVVQECQVVIGYALLDLNTSSGGHKVKIIDVERVSQRSAGLQATVQVEGQSFKIGVSHLLATSIVNRFADRIYTDATHDSSRYVFKSVGFTGYSPNNPCLLETRLR